MVVYRWTYGDPTAIVAVMDQVLRDVFKARVDVTESWDELRDLARLFGWISVRDETGCWNWIGGTNRAGYGVTSAGGKRRSAHRIIYKMLGGELEDDLTLDHLCRNRCCVNPEHLEPCTLEENVSRGWIADRDRPNRNREKAVCAKGHLYDEENTSYGTKGERRCKTCMRERKVIARRSEERSEREREIRRRSYHRNKGERLPPTAERTHCPKGHPYDDENTLTTTTGGRACRECRRAYERDLRARKRAAA